MLTLSLTARMPMASRFKLVLRFYLLTYPATGKQRVSLSEKGFPEK
jgi:hypothetical protein